MEQQDLKAFECELTVYRRGCLQVRVNLDQGTMVWKDSRQWCNNFVRTLSDDQIEEFRELAGRVQNTAAGTSLDQPTQNLMLTLFFKSEQFVLDAAQIDPAIWNKLRRMIEKLSRVPFHL